MLPCSWGKRKILPFPWVGHNGPDVGVGQLKSAAQLHKAESGLPEPGTEIRDWPRSCPPSCSLDWPTHGPFHFHPSPFNSAFPPACLASLCQPWKDSFTFGPRRWNMETSTHQCAVLATSKMAQMHVITCSTSASSGRMFELRFHAVLSPKEPNKAHDKRNNHNQFKWEFNLIQSESTQPLFELYIKEYALASDRFPNGCCSLRKTVRKKIALLK